MFLCLGKKNVWFFLLIITLLSCGTLPSEQAVSEIETNTIAVEVTAEQTPLFSTTLTNNANAFRELRPIKGQFDGGSWVEEVDAWNGRKHQLMQDIAEELNGTRHSEAAIIQLLGEPDQTIQKGEELYSTLYPEPSQTTGVSAQILIYHWRGNHDYLFLISEDDVVTHIDWWYAGE